MLCESRDNVVEEGVNIWAGEETGDFKPKYDIFILHGLGSHPYHAFLSDPVQWKSSQSRNGMFSTDSVVALRTSSSNISKASSSSREDPSFSPLITPMDSPWANKYSHTDLLGRIGTFWPRDLLPNDAKDARICTVGYKSQWTSPRFETDLQECGDSVLTTLDHARKGKQARSRPIVFIAHSYGGLVVLSALLSAKLNDRYASISRAFLGGIFLGTPFHGCEYAGHLSTFSDFRGNRQGILHSLRPDSRELEGLREGFIREYGARHLVSFYERCKTDIIHSVMLVPKEATQLGKAKSIGLYKDHRDLVKFGSAADDSYQTLIAELKDILKQATQRHAQRLARRRETHVPPRQHPVPPRSTSRQEVAMELDSTEVNARTVRRPRNPAELSTVYQEQPRPAYSKPASRDRYQTSAVFSTPPGAYLTKNPFENMAPQPGPSSKLPRPPENEGAALRQKNAAANADTTVKLPPHLRKSYQIMQARSNVEELPRNSKISHSQNSLPSKAEVEDSAEQVRTSKADDDARATHGSSGPRRTYQLPSTTADSSSLQQDYVHPSDFPAALRIGTNSQKAASEACDMFSPLDGVLRRPYPIRHLERVEHSLGSFHESVIIESHPETWALLVPTKSTNLPANRTAITGPLGSGKTSLAMACIKRLLSAPDTSIIWVTAESEAAIAEQLKAVASRICLDLERGLDPWSQLSACIKHLSSGGCGRSVIVLDDLQCKPPGKLDFRRLCPNGSAVYLLVTTARMSFARQIADEPSLICVGVWHPLYTASVLSHGAPVPDSPIYDQLAQQLENEPYAVCSFRDSLQSAGMSIIEYTTGLEYVLDSSKWAAGGRLVRRDLNNKSSMISVVVESCLNPSWFRMFDDLDKQEPSAAEMLSKLSVLGQRSIPSRLLCSNAGDTAATNALLDRFCLIKSQDDFHISQLIILAHRCWLLKRGGLAKPFKMALTMVANEYPDATNQAERQGCWEWEPFAKAATSVCALSWLAEDETCKGNHEMLAQKRRQLYRLSEQ